MRKRNRARRDLRLKNEKLYSKPGDRLDGFF